MGLEVLRSQEHLEPATQALIGELRPRPGQKDPAGHGPQLSSEVPPWIGRSQFMDSVCPQPGISTPEDEIFSCLLEWSLAQYVLNEAATGQSLP